jgi:uncharacterized membrane protein
MAGRGLWSAPPLLPWLSLLLCETAVGLLLSCAAMPILKIESFLPLGAALSRSERREGSMDEDEE